MLSKAELKRSVGGSVNINDDIRINGPNTKEKMRVSGNTTTFYTLTSDGTILVETIVKDGSNYDFSDQTIDTTLVWGDI